MGQVRVTASLQDSMPKTFSRTKFGTVKTNSDTNVDMMQIRAQQANRNKRVKPSMPKMPWD